MAVLGRRRRTVRTRGTMSKIVKVPGCGALRFIQCATEAQKQKAEVTRLIALDKWRGELLQMLRERDQREFELPENVLARKLRAEAAAEQTPALCADVPVEKRQKRPAALAATERITATCATLAAPDPTLLFSVAAAAGKKLRDAFKRDPTVAGLVNMPIMLVDSWPVKERAGMVREFFKRARVNVPVGIDVRDSLQNNGDAGKGGFLGGKIARNAGTVLALILPDIMGIHERSLCMGMPWPDGVQREFGQLLGGVFNTKILPTDQEINAAIYNIGPTAEPGVHLAAVISTQKIQPGDEIIVQYDNRAH